MTASSGAGRSTAKRKPRPCWEAIRATGHPDTHDHVVAFLAGWAVEAGKAADDGRPMAGDLLSDGRYGVLVPGTPVLISYSRYPGMREFRVTDVVRFDG